MNSNNETVNLLWTSGWDSTYRLMDLLLQGRTIQPYYICFRKRKSTAMELKRIDEIREYLVGKDKKFAQAILPTIIIEEESIQEVPEIRESYQKITQNHYLGNQYVLLASYACNSGIRNLELSIHADDKARQVIKNDVEFVNDHWGGYYRIKADSKTPAAEMFRDFVFPILTISKLEMQEDARKRGFLDVMEMTWFCHRPTPDGKPCGMCHPCIYTRREGLGRRVPKEPLRRIIIRNCKRFIRKYIYGKPVA